ncbi:MAG: hypothetical protein ABI411_20730 [Tahibacter sp.]
MSRTSCFLWLILTELGLLLPSGVAAQSILLTPGSLVLTDQQRSGEITVANTEKRPVSFRVEPALFRMRPDGFLDEVDSLPLSAAALLRFAPRQFELDPGGAQVVKVAFRAPSDLPNGEYRLHLRLRNMGAPLSASPAGSTEEPAVVGEVELKIPVTVARAVRIMVRHGVGPGSVELGNVKAQRAGAQAIQIDLSLLNQHTGGSAIGMLVFDTNQTVLPGRAGEIARRRYSVYADLDQRDYHFLLPTPSGMPAQICVGVLADNAAAGSQPVDRRCTPV